MIIKTSLALAFAALSALPVAAEPFHHPFGEWREYNQDWLAACPDVIKEDATDFYGVSCFASAGSQALNSANLPDYKVSLLLNRLTGVIDIAFTFAADGPSADQDRPLVLKFNGEAPRRFFFATDLETRYKTTNQFYITDPERRDTVLELMKSHNGLTLTVPVMGGRNATSEVQLSLRGVTASLDFMATYARKVAQY